MIERERLERNYRAAFLRFLPNRDEAALHAGYQIGRQAITGGLTLFDLVQVHHRVLLEVLGPANDNDLDAMVEAASDFLVEVLATHEIARRRLLADTPPGGGEETDPG